MQEIEVGIYQSLSIGRTSKVIPLPYPKKGWGGGGGLGLMEPPPKIFTLLMHSEIILN